MSDRVKFSCPACGKRLSTQSRHAGRRGRCPRCGHVWRLPQFAETQLDVQFPESDPTDSTSHQAFDIDLPEITPTSEPVSRRRSSHVQSNKYLVIGLVALLGVSTTIFVFVVLARRLQASQLPRVPQGLFMLAFFVGVIVLGYLTAVHKVRRLRRIIYFIIWFAPFLLPPMLLSLYDDPNSPSGGFLCFSCLGFLWLPFGYLPARLLTPIILALIVQRLTCPSCHEVHELVERWQCSCGYMDHRERNILLYRCPVCRGYIGHTKCDRCDATILI